MLTGRASPDTFPHIKVTSFAAVMLLFATPVTASGVEAFCLSFVENIEQAFDDRDAGLSRRELETALADRLAAPDIPDETDKAVAKMLALVVDSTPFWGEVEILLYTMSSCLESDLHDGQRGQRGRSAN